MGNRQVARVGKSVASVISSSAPVRRKPNDSAVTGYASSLAARIMPTRADKVSNTGMLHGETCHGCRSLIISPRSIAAAGG